VGGDPLLLDGATGVVERTVHLADEPLFALRDVHGTGGTSVGWLDGLVWLSIE
jgi:hypothetical protein